MAYDEALALRVRAVMPDGVSFEERRMFGSLALLLSGNMCCCVMDKGLMVRVGQDAYENALARPHTGPMEMNGRSMSGWVLVAWDGLQSEAALRDWVARGVEFAATLPAKGTG